MSNNVNVIEEKTNLCARVLISWAFKDSANVVYKNSKDVVSSFIGSVLLGKLECIRKETGIMIVIPDELIVIIDICTNSNPGVSQIILKEILESVVKRKGKIKNGQAITSTDFSLCFAKGYPILEIESINKEYMKKWDNQKISDEEWELLKSDNKCDTLSWWTELLDV